MNNPQAGSRYHSIHELGRDAVGDLHFEAFRLEFHFLHPRRAAFVCVQAGCPGPVSFPLLAGRRVLFWHRSAAAGPWPHPAAAARALHVRLGAGGGGYWLHAVSCRPSSPARRIASSSCHCSRRSTMAGGACRSDRTRSAQAGFDRICPVSCSQRKNDRRTARSRFSAPGLRTIPVGPTRAYGDVRNADRSVGVIRPTGGRLPP